MECGATLIETIKIGDLVYQDRLWQRYKVGVVIEIYHEGSANEGLKVKMLNGDVHVAPTNEWRLVY